MNRNNRRSKNSRRFALCSILAKESLIERMENRIVPAEFLITSSLGGRTKVGDITYQQGDTVSPIQLYVYLRYTASEVTASGGTG